ncbi:MAG TPA: nickel pincer cofactor biosynthesis protein LarC [Clostridiaceae bacterium]|nr:nickel pincer cofactor biosynthesis protein LarC [Clostridiaceae bacterium]
MRILYFDCGMGAAGDMIAGALYDLLEDKRKQEFLEIFNSLNLPGVEIIPEVKSKCGINGIDFIVKVYDEIEGEHESHHTHHNDHHHAHDHHQDHEYDYHLNHDCEHDHDDHHNHHDHDHHNSPHHHHVHYHDHDNHHHDHDHNHHDHDNHHHYHDHDHEHKHYHHVHRSMQEIENIIYGFNLNEDVKKDIINVYRIIAEAESESHGVPVTEIHFHEVGTMDAIADITAVCILLKMLDVDRIIASPIHVGSGFVRCAHGILPVPAPATANILRDVPIYGGEIKAELCTPTGAALLKYFADSFEIMPTIKIKKIGYGHGKKDFAVMNSLRVLLADAEDDLDFAAKTDLTDSVCVLSCNVDDMTAEEISFATDCFFSAGALDVYTIPLGMKKSRPGTLISLICYEESKDELIQLMFKHTSTIGIRENICNRYVLNRSFETVETPYGNIRKKIAVGYDIIKEKPEYSDLAAIAKQQNLSLAELKELLDKQ